MSDLVEWLRACIAEDEAEALEWRRRCSPSLPTLAEPAHVLAVCAAHRAIVELHANDDGNCSTCGDENGWTGDGDGGEFFDNDRSAVDFPCDTIKALAGIYADRPGYREEWRL